MYQDNNFNISISIAVFFVNDVDSGVILNFLPKILNISGVYLHRAQQGVFPPPKKFTKNSRDFIINYVEVLLRCLYGNININLCFSFPRFAREGAHPPPAPTPLGRQGSPLLQLLPCFPPPKFLGQIKPCIF